MLLVDGTGFVEKGAKSCGVARQYAGTAGRVGNAPVGVFPAHTGPKGHALVDRALDRPKERADDRGRCGGAGVPKPVGFAAKPRPAERMLRRAWRAGVPAGWAAGDAVYGSDGAFRRFLGQHRRPYVLAVRADRRLWVGLAQRRVDAIAAGLPAGAWRRASAGAGARGPRWYDGAVRAVGPVGERGWRPGLLARRHPDRADERAYDPCRGPAATPWPERARAAGCRWAVEAGFELAKGDCGPDEYAVRPWAGWRRHVTLRRLAPAVVAVIRSRVPAPRRKKGASG